jgi:transposase
MPLAILEDKRKRVRTQLALAVPSEVIAMCVNLSRHSVQRFIKNIREHGTINHPPNGRRGRRTHISPQVEQELVSMLTHSRSKKQQKLTM